MTNKIPYSNFKHGQRCTCEIGDKKIKNAKISIDRNGDVFVCQNIYNGFDTENLLGYEFAVCISEDKEDYEEGDAEITNLILLPRTIEDVEEGDYVLHLTGGTCKVLGICGEVVFLSEDGEDEEYSDGITISSLKKYGWIIKQDTPPEEENGIYNVCNKCLKRLINGQDQEDNHVECDKVPLDQLRIKE